MVSCIIVCGGRSTRMGRDKRSLTLGGKTFLEMAVRTARILSDDIVLTVGSDGQKRSTEKITDLPVFVDEVEGVGPLMGVLTGLRHVRDEYAAVLPIDTPNVRPELMGYLVELRTGYDAVIPEDGGYLDPLHAVYRRAPMIDACEKTLQAGKRGVYLAAKSLERVNLVPVETLRRFDPDLSSFKSVDTPEDLEELRAG